jgi:hypothetical protein
VHKLLSPFLVVVVMLLCALRYNAALLQTSQDRNTSPLTTSLRNHQRNKGEREEESSAALPVQLRAVHLHTSPPFCVFVVFATAVVVVVVVLS